jgi:hypothetical protein
VAAALDEIVSARCGLSHPVLDFYALLQKNAACLRHPELQSRPYPRVVSRHASVASSRAGGSCHVVHPYSVNVPSQVESRGCWPGGGKSSLSTSGRENERGFIHKFIRVTLRNPFRSIGCCCCYYYYKEKGRGVTGVAARLANLIRSVRRTRRALFLRSCCFLSVAFP